MHVAPRWEWIVKSKPRLKCEVIYWTWNPIDTKSIIDSIDWYRCSQFSIIYPLVRTKSSRCQVIAITRAIDYAWGRWVLAHVPNSNIIAVPDIRWILLIIHIGITIVHRNYCINWGGNVHFDPSRKMCVCWVVCLLEEFYLMREYRITRLENDVITVKLNLCS